MVETISPVVYGDRRKWRAALGLHALGATGAGAGFGAILGGAGGIWGSPHDRASLAVVGALAAAYAAKEALGVGALPIPQARRQVPNWWRTFFAWPAAALLYGAGLGIGFATYVAHGTLVVVSGAAFLSGRPLVGAILLAPFGLARGISPVATHGIRSEEDGRRLVDRLANASVGRRKALNAVALGAVAATATWGIARSQGPWQWGRLSAAALASVFAWAAGSKIVGWRRWARTLKAHKLPPRLRRVVMVAVPAAEAAVPVFVVLGSPRVGGAAALALVTAFSFEAARLRVIGGMDRVPCSCFGGRGSLGWGAALFRNAAIAALAVAATRASGAARLALPPLPRTADVFPLAIAAAGLITVALTGWRAARWLREGT